MISNIRATSYDHTCEACGKQDSYDHTKIRWAYLLQDGGVFGMAHHCACGASEHFNTGLTQEDETSATRTPESREQARAIRALMRHMGLPTK